MGPTGDVINVIQIHPTRRCNLRCHHCYSTSGPEYTNDLPIEPLERLLADAAKEGFNALGLSGGEPLTYPYLTRLLASARALGFFTSVTTNGLLLDKNRVAELAPHLSLLAISIDGTPASHDKMRGRRGTFEMLRAKLDNVRAMNVPFGFIFTLTMANLHELGWVAEFAAAEGASAVQIHPLERAGRAREADLVAPDDLELAYAFLEVARLRRQLSQRVALQYDVADRMLIEREPYRAFAINRPASAPENQPLASIMSPLVVQDDGWIVPIQHGFSKTYAIGRVDGGSFAQQALRWKQKSYTQFLNLARSVWSEMRTAPAHLPFTNWYAAIRVASCSDGQLAQLDREPRSMVAER